MKFKCRFFGAFTLFAILVAFCSHASARQILIEVYGDSTTEGWTVKAGTGSRSARNEPAILQSKLQSAFGNDIYVANYGIGGTEASNLLNGTGAVTVPWSRRMATSTAQIVMVNFGQNDALYANVSKPKATPETPDDYARVMSEIVTIARAAGKIVVIEEPNPSCMTIRARALPAYVEKLKDVARQQNVPLVAQHDYIQSRSDWMSLLSDCVHPTEALYELKAQKSLDVLAPIVETLLH